MSILGEMPVTWGTATLFVAFLGGCGSVQVCHERSQAVDKEVVFECSERSNAKLTVVICDLIASSAREMVQTNRRIGPTTPKELLAAGAKDQAEAVKIIRDSLGQKTAEVYITMLAGLSEDVANRNITDLVGYPEQKWSNCVTKEGFQVAK